MHKGERTHARTHARTHTHTHARARARTHAHTHTHLAQRDALLCQTKRLLADLHKPLVAFFKGVHVVQVQRTWEHITRHTSHVIHHTSHITHHARPLTKVPLQSLVFLNNPGHFRAFFRQ